MRVQAAVRNWWPVLGFMALSLASQTVFTSNVVAIGQHASDHLKSATAPFAIAFLLAVIVWAAPKARHVDVGVVAAILAVAACVVLFGNLRVIDSIAGEAWNDTQANIFGPARSGFTSGHSLAEVGEWATLAAVILLTVVLLMRWVVRRGPGIAAVVLSLVIPAHLIPGAGLFVLAADVCFQRRRRLKDAASSAAPPQTMPM